jgi:CBS domain containing-hemolysin-like protein
MKPAIELFREMREKASQVAIVVDEYSSVCGIVTFEDLVEEVVGEIHDEFDKPRNKIKFNDDGSITVRGDVPLFELNEVEEFNFTSIKGVATINGLIQAYLGKIPCAGESFLLDGFRMRIIASDERKIEWIKILRTQVEK